jgi:hypothetical protein
MDVILYLGHHMAIFFYVRALDVVMILGRMCHIIKNIQFRQC